MRKNRAEILLEEEGEVGGFPKLDKYLEGRARHWISYSEGAKMYLIERRVGHACKIAKWMTGDIFTFWSPNHQNLYFYRLCVKISKDWRCKAYDFL